MKTSQKHFEIFEKEVKHWVKEFGLTGWQIYFRHGGTDKGSFAGCSSNLAGKAATFFLAKNWDDVIVPLTEKNIKKSALHEVIHLVFARLSALNSARYVSEDECTEAEEEVVNIFMNYLK